MRNLLSVVLFQSAFILPSVSWAGKDVSLEKLPDAVRTTVERETKGGQIKDIEQDQEAGQLIYEVEFVLNGQEHELDIAADGTLLERRLD